MPNTSITVSSGTYTLSAVDSKLEFFVNNSGTLDVVSGGTILKGLTIDAFGAANVSVGGIVYSTVIDSGGTESIYAGGQTINGGGSTISTTINSGGRQIIYAGNATDTLVNGGGYQENYEGIAVSTIVGNAGTAAVVYGITMSAIVSSGGTEIISAPGQDVGAVLLDGGLQIVNGVATSVTVASGGEQYIGSGGDSMAAQIQGGGAEVVFSTDSSASLSGNSSATATQYDFGISYDGTTFSNGFQEIAPGATASGMTVEFGGQQYIGSGGTALGTEVASGGAEVVFGFDSGASLSGTQYDYGTASGGTTNADGFQQVAPRGVAVSMTIKSGGEQYIGSGGTAQTANVGGQGAQVVFGFALGTLVSGTQYDFALAVGGTVYNDGLQQVAPGAVAIGMTIASGGQQYVGAGGTASATTIAPQGVEQVFGRDSGALVSGTQYVFGVASGGTTFNSGYQLVAPAGAGTALGMTVLAGGQQYVVGGGTASGTELMSQGIEIVHGTDLSATISGTQYVFGLASGTVVGTGGYQLVSAGGTTSAASISGGTIELMNGAANGAAPITYAGAGELILDASTSFSGTVAGFGLASPNDTIDFADISYVPAGSAGATTMTWSQLTSGANASGTLMVAQGGHTADVTLLGQYVAGNFTPSGDGHGGTLVIDPPVAPVTDANPQVLTTTRQA